MLGGQSRVDRLDPGEPGAEPLITAFGQRMDAAEANVDVAVQQRCSLSQVTRFSGCPSAALASSTMAGPRSTYAVPTARIAPITGPIR